MEKSEELINVIHSVDVEMIMNEQFLLKPIKIDLDDNNIELKNLDTLNTEILQEYISSKVKKNNGTIATGGYLEQRSRYSNSDLFLNTKEPRSIHLGVDLWIEAGTAVYAPLNSTVHSFQNNSNYLDYGPTLILKHEINGTSFHTLYGHLTIESLNGISLGEHIKKGQKIGELGQKHENGDWPPHLHFQIIQDLQGKTGDYPGVATKKEVDFYKRNCPDPNLLLRLES